MSSREDLREMIRGKARVRPFLLNVLVPLHVMAEVAGLSISVQQTAVPGDTANETHSAWRIDFAGLGGKRCTMKWCAVRRWNASRVYTSTTTIFSRSADPDHGRLEFGFGSFGGRFRLFYLRARGFLEGESTESLIRFKGGPAFRTNLGLGPYLAELTSI
jgi:hypothetical protein